VLREKWETLRAAEDALARCRQDLEAAMTALERTRALKEALEARRATLHQSTEGTCPVCAQPLPQDHRESLLQHLEEEAQTLEAQERRLQEQVKTLQNLRRTLEEQLQEAQRVNLHLERLRAQGQTLDQQLRETEAEIQRWKEEDEPEWQALRQALTTENFAPQLRQELQDVEARLAALGYDEQAHREAREAEARGQEIQEQIRRLEQWKARLEAVEEELKHLEQEKALWQTRAQERERAYQEARERLEALGRDMPDLTQLKQRVLHLRERVARLQEMRGALRQLQEQRGALRQRLELLERYRQEAQEIRRKLEELGVLLARYQTLEEAFGRNGVPALTGSGTTRPSREARPFASTSPFAWPWPASWPAAPAPDCSSWSLTKDSGARTRWDASVWWKPFKRCARNSPKSLSSPTWKTSKSAFPCVSRWKRGRRVPSCGW